MDLATIKPINKTAALVVSEGEHYNILEIKNFKLYALCPPITKKPTNLPERIGRLKIIGYINKILVGIDKTDKKNIVVRCDCGKYELKTRKFLTTKKTNFMCSECNYRERNKYSTNNIIESDHIKENIINSSKFNNIKTGLLTVKGLYKCDMKYLVVKCMCGRYELRKIKKFNENNQYDKCESCNKKRTKIRRVFFNEKGFWLSNEESFNLLKDYVKNNNNLK